jgi:hypothetical protein
MITSDIKPVLALQTGLLAVGDKVYIKGRGFLVQEFDEISNPGIGYYSLVATTIGKDDLEKNKDKTFFIIKKKEANINYGNKNNEEIFVSIVPNQTTLISTERGYFKSSLNSIKVLSITEREVSFSIPFGVDTFTVTTLKNGREYKTTYKAVK